jgi:hypothetical protein
MRIRTIDFERLNERLSSELAAGNILALYDPTLLVADIDKLQFFPNYTAAFSYLQHNAPVTNNHVPVSLNPFQQMLDKVLKAEANQNEMDYYWISDSSPKVVKVTFPNSDEVNISVLDDNDLKQILPARPVQVKEAVSESMKALRLNFDELRSQLNKQGFDSDFFMTVEASMLRGAEKHEERYFSIYGASDEEKVMYTNLFAKDKDGHYSLDKITGTLYSKMDIEHTIINGIDTKSLENKLDTASVLNEGKTIFKEYELEFRQLCDDRNGRQIAVIMYNNIIPLWSDKPEFISRIEDDLKIYPTMEFSGYATRTEVYESLKRYEAISKALMRSAIPGIQDETSKTALIEKLVNGEHCQVIVASGPMKGKEIILDWDRQANALSFLDNQLEVAQFLENTNSEGFELILTELKLYPFRHWGNSVFEQQIVNALLDGDKRILHLEKTIIPAEHIDECILVEYSTAEGQRINPVEISRGSNVDKAVKEMQNLSNKYMDDECETNTKLMLIGQYKGMELKFDQYGIPTTNSGYAVASSIFSQDGYHFSSNEGFNRTNILVEPIFVEKDKVADKLVFTDRHGDPIVIDKTFWTLEQKSGLDTKKSDTKDSLLPKLRDNEGKGKANSL